MTAGTIIKAHASDTLSKPTRPFVHTAPPGNTRKAGSASIGAAPAKLSADCVRYLGTTALRSNHPDVKALRRQGHQPSIHGTKVWRSSFVVMKYLKHNPIPEGAKVMDIGCGWGLTGIYLAKRYQAKVTGIDADASVKPYLDAQAKINKVNIQFEHKSIERIRRHEMRGFHTLIGSDVCFWDELVEPLYNLVTRAADVGVRQILIADPGRSPFWELAKRCENKFGGKVQEMSIRKPCKTRKHILILQPNGA
jgi:predicted nicotinamide N-methyase